MAPGEPDTTLFPQALWRKAQANAALQAAAIASKETALENGKATTSGTAANSAGKSVKRDSRNVANELGYRTRALSEACEAIARYLSN